MPKNLAIQTIEDQQWLDEFSTTVQKAMGEFWKSGGDPLQMLKNALHGTWIGHPLHPILTDIPIGAWTMAFFFDVGAELTESETMERAADFSIATGLLGALGAALVGITDWSDTDGKARNVGMMHAMLNILATALYTASYIARKRDDRGSGVYLAMIGACVMTFSAYLSGHLIYGEQIGVDHKVGQPYPQKFTPAMGQDELRSNKPTRAEIDGAKILLVRQGGEIHAISETCPHMGGPLSEGKLGKHCDIVCPWHASRFSLEDGAVLDGPATQDAELFKVRIRNRKIEVKLDNG